MLLLENACVALNLGRTNLALKHITALDELSASRAFLPNAGAYERLRSLLTFHTEGAEAAFERARRAEKRFAGKNVLYYLDAVAALAFLERMTDGAYSLETNKALDLFESLGFRGMRQHLTHQGFLA